MQITRKLQIIIATYCVVEKKTISVKFFLFCLLDVHVKNNVHTRVF